MSALYLQHFGLREPPFSLTPDTAYFFAYGPYREALDTLLLAVIGGEGFVKVTGEVGTGKTMLCRTFLNALDEEFVTAYVPNPQLTPAALHAALAEELGLRLPRNLGQQRLLQAINTRLLTLAGEGKRVVLCLDEAQALPLEALEALRLLTNLETEKRKLLQVVLFGQPELDRRLDTPGVRQIKQRITFSYRLPPLDRQAMAHYLGHRLATAGAPPGPLFSAAAVRLLHRASGGLPRLVNILGHKALMLAYGQGVSRVGRRHVALAARDTEAARRSRPLGAAALSAGVAMALAAAGAYAYFGAAP